MTGDKMTIWDIIPTCDDPMSCYTLVAFAIIVTGNVVSYTLLVKWTVNGFKELRAAIKDHDRYIDDTAKVFNQIQTELAVQESSMKTLKEDISEIKTDVKTLLTR